MCAVHAGRSYADVCFPSPRCAAVGSLGNAEGRAAFLELPSKLPGLKYIGFAVTDAGIAKDSQVIKDLAEFLLRCYETIPGKKERANALNVEAP